MAAAAVTRPTTESGTWWATCTARGRRRRGRRGWPAPRLAAAAVVAAAAVLRTSSALFGPRPRTRSRRRRGARGLPAGGHPFCFFFRGGSALSRAGFISFQAPLHPQTTHPRTPAFSWLRLQTTSAPAAVQLRRAETQPAAEETTARGEGLPRFPLQLSHWEFHHHLGGPHPEPLLPQAWHLAPQPRVHLQLWLHHREEDLRLLARTWRAWAAAQRSAQRCSSASAWWRDSCAPPATPRRAPLGRAT